MLIASNQSLAEYNLTKEPELISTKERLCEMYIDAEKLYKSITEKVNTISKYYYFLLLKLDCTQYYGNAYYTYRFMFRQLNR